MNILRRIFQPAVIVALCLAVTMSVAGREAMAGGYARCPCDFSSTLDQANEEASHLGTTMSYTYCTSDDGVIIVGEDVVVDWGQRGVHADMGIGSDEMNDSVDQMCYTNTQVIEARQAAGEEEDLERYERRITQVRNVITPEEARQCRWAIWWIKWKAHARRVDTCRVDYNVD